MAKGIPTDVWKRSLEDYEQSAAQMSYSMGTIGFDPSHPIDIDPDGEILNGSHRVACALAHRIEKVPVVRHEQRAWAPAWDGHWFVAHGMDPTELERLLAVMRLM